MTTRIRAVDDDADLEHFVELVNTITPDDPTSVTDARWSDATWSSGSSAGSSTPP